LKNINKNGSTLVECIAAFALFSISTFILLSGFLTSANLIAKASQVKNNSNNIIDVVETTIAKPTVTVTQSSTQNFSFKLGSGALYTTKGSYKTGECEGIRLTEFIPDNNPPLIVIPDTDMPINGRWPVYDDYPNQWASVIVPKGTTFESNGVYYIAASDLDISPRGATPTGGWWYNNNTGLIVISSRPVLVWNGGTQSEFYEFTNHYIDRGDKVYWNGYYYVFTNNRQSHEPPPNISTTNWAKVTNPLGS